MSKRKASAIHSSPTDAPLPEPDKAVSAHIQNSLVGAVYQTLMNGIEMVPSTQLGMIEVEFSFGQCMQNADERLYMEVAHRVMLTEFGFDHFESHVEKHQFMHVCGEMERLCGTGKFKRVQDAPERQRVLEMKYPSGLTDVREIARGTHTTNVNDPFKLPEIGRVMKQRKARSVVFQGVHVSPVDFSVRVSTENTKDTYTQEPRRMVRETRIKDRIKYALQPHSRWEIHLSHVVSVKDQRQRYEIEAELVERFPNGDRPTTKQLTVVAQEIVEISAFLNELIKNAPNV